MPTSAMQRLERLENPGGQDKAPQPKTRQDPVTCRRCGKEGHFARGCATRPRNKGVDKFFKLGGLVINKPSYPN